MNGEQKPVTNVRFSPEVIAAAKRVAAKDYMSLSALVRRIVEREIARREGKCPSCGHEVPPQ